MSGHGFHWSACRSSGGGGGGVFAVFAVLAVVGIVAAARSVWHTIAAPVAEAVLIAALTIIGAVTLCVLAGLAAVVLAVRRHVLARRLAVAPRVRAELADPDPDPDPAGLTGRVVPELTPIRPDVVTPFRVPEWSRRREGDSR